MKLVGGDSGRCEHETFVEEVLLSPSERAVVDVLFDTPGEVHLAHRTPDHGGHAPGDHGDGLEREDLMPEINRTTNPSNMIWKLVDRESGAENHRISWSFKVGERAKIRLVNEMVDSDHPMHHPSLVRGAGRSRETGGALKDPVLPPEPAA